MNDWPSFSVMLTAVSGILACLTAICWSWGQDSESFSSVEFDFEVVVYKCFGALTVKFLMVIW